MGKPKAPPTPDPFETAGAQTAQNVSTAIAQQQLNNIDQVTPYGSLTHEQTGTFQFTDPNTGAVYDVPKITATQTLSPDQQELLDINTGTQKNLATLASDQSAFLGDYMAEPFSYNPGEHEEWALGLYDDLNADSNARADEALRTRLANQGITGGEAYDREMQAAAEGRQRSRDAFLLDSYQTGFNTDLTERNQPINEIIGLLSGSQVQQPTLAPTNPAGISNVDVAGLIQDDYRNQYGAYQDAYNQRSQMLGGLFGIGARAIGF